MKFRIFLVLFFLLGLAACSEEENGWWSHLAVAAKSKCGHKVECTIDLSGIYPFEWDDAYIFSSSTRKKEIERVVGSKLPIFDYEESCQHIVFRDAKQVVRVEHSRCSGIELRVDVPAATFVFLRVRDNYLHLKRGSALCATRFYPDDDDSAFYGLTLYSMNNGCMNLDDIDVRKDKYTY